MSKVLSLGSFVCALSMATLAFGAQRAPVVYEVTSLVQGTKLSLAGGREAQLQLSWAGDKVYFEDLMPGANWDHPAKVKVVNRLGKVTQELKLNRPPTDLSNAPVVSGSVPNDLNPVFKLGTYDGKLKVADPSKFHAILINGHADKRHWNDFSFLYRVLTQVYGYDRENIIVVDGAYKDKLPDMDDDGNKDIGYSSTKQGIKDAMAALKEKVKTTDHLLLAINDHGGSLDGESTIVAYDGEMKVSEFAPLLKEIKAKKVLSLFEQCFSGGFVRPTLGSMRVSMSAARNDEYSWASNDLMWDEWIYHAIAGFAMQTHDGRAVAVDTNSDGKVSAAEAFAYSVAKEQASESPLLESVGNSGDALDIGLGF